MNWEQKWNVPPSLQHQASWSLLEAAPAPRFLAACNRHKLAISWAEGVLIYLLVATTLLMKSAILMVTADVVPSPSFQSSFIWPPIPDKVTLMVINVGIEKFGILSPSLGSTQFILIFIFIWPPILNKVTVMVVLIMIAIKRILFLLCILRQDRNLFCRSIPGKMSKMQRFQNQLSWMSLNQNLIPRQAGNISNLWSFP